jgi:hypothetical protein
MKKGIIVTLMLTGVFVQAFSQSNLSGSSYRFSPNAYVAFTDNSFSGSWNKDTPMSGTYSVAGGKLTLNITSGPKAKNSWVWTIVNANTLKDQDGDTWSKESEGASKGSAPAKSNSAGGASAGSSSDIKNWISGEVSILGVGARYERMLNDKMSIGANVYYDTLFFLWQDFEAGAAFRYYPWGGTDKPVRGLFFGAGLGFHIYWNLIDVLLDEDDWSALYGVAITPDIGWRLDVGDPGGFFIEPGIKMPLTLGARKVPAYYDDWDWDDNDSSSYKFDWAFGFIPYIGLGFAF